MRRFIAFVCICLLSAASVTASAKGIDPKADSLAMLQIRQKMASIRKHRPTVALVLSGGGAKGAAHISVIRVLEAYGIPIDMVLGTSMGGLIGGLYALGYTPDQMDSIVKNMDWGWAFSDELPREYVSYADMKYKEKYLISVPFYYEKDYYRMKLADDNRFDPVHRHEILDIGADSEDGTDFLKKNLLGSLPSGYIYGHNVSNMISSLTVGYQDYMKFIDLPIPFVCVAADMVSGKAKIWYEGHINDAMRSTMSIPGIFAPVRVDGMVLVDGGLRDNYPTTLARDLGADIIIGVDLSQARRTYMEVNNIGDIVGQGIDMLGMDAFERNVNVPDVKIKPDLKGFNMLSFNKESIDTIMIRGTEAAFAQDSLLLEVAMRTRGGYTPRTKKPALNFHQDSILISEIDVTGVLPKEKELLMDRLRVNLGDRISKDGLDDIVAQIYGTQAYDYVTYEFQGSEEPYRLVFNCKKGPIHQFGLGVRADTEEIVSVLVNVGLNVHQFYGHTFDFTGKISSNPYMQLHWYYDMPKVPTINATASFRWANMNRLGFGDNSLSLNYFCASQEAYLSHMKWRQFDIRGGLRNEIFDIRNIKSSQIIGDYDFGQLTNDFVSVFVDAKTDTFDDGYFPSKGVMAGLSYAWTLDGFPNKFHHFHTLEADVRGVIAFKDNIFLTPYFSSRMLFGTEIPVAYFNAIGGFVPSRYVEQQIPFVGITNLVAMKNILTLYGAELRQEIMNNHFVSASLNYVKDSDRMKDYFKGKGYFGACLGYSYDTIFGPLSANLHWSNLNDKVGIYISAGYNF